VAEGRILTNRLVRLACERHLADLSSATARGLRFDRTAARHAIDFFGFLRHSKGEWAGGTFALAPWQAFGRTVAAFGINAVSTPAGGDRSA
jgi:phage terminase large subunit-like protein